jgi:DNA-binding YbaB/EbfC family protein
MRGQMASLMPQAQKMQEQLKRTQEELAQLEVEGQAGGGMVRVTMNGAHAVRRVRIEPRLAGGGLEMLADLVAAACNDALTKANAMAQQRMNEVAGGMGLPPGMKLPF